MADLSFAATRSRHNERARKGDNQPRAEAPWRARLLAGPPVGSLNQSQDLPRKSGGNASEEDANVLGMRRTNWLTPLCGAP